MLGYSLLMSYVLCAASRKDKIKSGWEERLHERWLTRFSNRNKCIRSPLVKWSKTMSCIYQVIGLNSYSSLWEALFEFKSFPCLGLGYHLLSLNFCYPKKCIRKENSWGSIYCRKDDKSPIDGLGMHALKTSRSLSKETGSD